MMPISQPPLTPDWFFPLEALGPLLPLVEELRAETGAPYSSIISALLCVMSLVAQGRIRVRKGKGLISPVSLWMIVVQGSGERKTTVVRKLLQAVESFISEQNATFSEKLVLYSAELNAWHAADKGLRDAIRKKTARGQSPEIERQQLVDLAKKKPRRPKPFKLIHERATVQALLTGIADSLPTTALISDEAGCVFDSRVLSELGVLTKAWDGSTITSDLISRGNIAINDPSLTLGLFVQREILDRYFRKKGELARASGFLPRCYVVSPPETAGSRFRAYAGDPGHDAQDRFAERCQELLREHLGGDGQRLPDKITMVFSAEAQARWEQEHDIIESNMAPGGFFVDFKDFGSKHADRIARLAAILQYFLDGSSEISRATLERSIAISSWFANAFVAYFMPAVPPPAPPPEVVYAQEITIWLARYIRDHNFYFVKRNHVRTSGPAPTRNKQRLDAALRILCAYQFISVGCPPGDKTTYIYMNPNYFTQFEISRLCGAPILWRTD